MDEPLTDPLLDLMDATEGHYNKREFSEAAISINKVWVGTYEGVHVAHDMIPLLALLLLERVENFPSTQPPEPRLREPKDWWFHSFNESLSAIESLCRECLDRI